MRGNQQLNVMLRIAIVSPAIQLSGGMKQKLRLATALAKAGNVVDVVTPDGSLDVYDFRGSFKTPEAALGLSPYDVAVVTWFETYELASRLAPRVFHFCQGIESDLEHLAGAQERISALYERALPTLTISPHLARRLRREFGTPTQVMSPLLDPAFRPRWWRRGPHDVPIVLVHGIFESAVKRIDVALKAFALLHRARPARLWRVSTFPQSEAERALAQADAYHHQAHPHEVARLTSLADLTLFTSDEGEGFGLPVLESLAAGIPVVALRISSLASFEHLGLVETVEKPDPHALVGAMLRALEPEAWTQARARAKRFTALWRNTQEERAAAAFGRLEQEHRQRN